jgi:NAD(P)-dependent dehydrogenase (short-subunit alcohol dehydrogenase family)
MYASGQLANGVNNNKYASSNTHLYHFINGNISSLDKIMDGIDVNKIAIVTGSSSGIGLETSLTLAENNFTTYATMRNLDKASNILEVSERKNLSINVVQLDVTDDTSVQQAIQFVSEKEGRIDLLVNNAGYALLGSAEDLCSEDIQAQFNTNLFGGWINSF